MYIGLLNTVGGHACSMYYVHFHIHTHSPIRGVPVALVLL